MTVAVDITEAGARFLDATDPAPAQRRDFLVPPADGGRFPEAACERRTQAGGSPACPPRRTCRSSRWSWAACSTGSTPHCGSASPTAAARSRSGSVNTAITSTAMTGLPQFVGTVGLDR